MYLNFTTQMQIGQVMSKPGSYSEPTTYTAHTCESNQKITRKGRLGGGTKRATHANREVFLLTTPSPYRVGRKMGSKFLQPILFISSPRRHRFGTAVSIPSTERLEHSHLGPMMTGPAKSEDRRGSEVCRLPIIGAKGFPSAASLVSVSELCSMQLARATFINTHTETPQWQH